jgi:serine/threonine protein kinase
MGMIPWSGQILDGPSGANTLRLEEPLGAGAFGLVFSATDLSNGQTVAVKFPQIGVLRDSAELAAFANEIRAAQEIEHPNIVRVLFTKADPGGLSPPYLVMEYVPGGTLQHFLEVLREQDSWLSVGDLKAWLNQLVDAMEAINAQMLHRDIKPDNILIDQGTLKITDFGLSKIVDAATRTKTFKGRQHVLYMAPEGWKLETNAVQLDMYSMGIVFFEMITLEFPYELPIDLRNLEGFRKMHLFQAPRSAKDLREDTPIGVDQVIQRMLAKRAKDRFEKWSDARRSLASAWDELSEDSGSITRSLVIELLEESSALHRRKAREESERDHEAHRIDEDTGVFEWQIEQLVSSIRKTIEEYNERSALGAIDVRQVGLPTAWKVFVCDIPLTGSVQLKFHRLDPPAPVALKRGLVPLYGYLADGDGIGFNYVLVREDKDDLYGAWQTCKVSIHALASPKEYPRRQGSFGFELPDDFRKHVQKADESMHVYTCQFEPTRPNQFLEVVLEFMRRRKRHPARGDARP